MRTKIALLLLLAAWACDSPGAPAGDSGWNRTREAANGGDAAHMAWIEANYDKSEHMVAMRDGAELFTIVYSPRFAAEPVPVMHSSGRPRVRDP